MQFTDTAIVTGAASGLGAATAFTLASRGASVFGFDLASSIEKADVVPGVTLLSVDVTDEQQVAVGLARARDSGTPLRVVVNCAGIGPSARTLGKSGPHDLELFRRVVGINLVGTFVVTSLAAAEIAKASPDVAGQRGVIINTASVAAFEGQIGQVAYSASKAGVAGMTLPLARDLSSVGIRVCTVAPGIIDTPMLSTVSDEFRAALSAGVPFPKRLGRPAEYAQLVAMIVEHDYLNGETIRMDGALRMAPR